LASYSYIHEHPDWPRFRWRNEAILQLLSAVRHRQGRPKGQMESLGFDLRQEAILRTLTQDVVKTSEIEASGSTRNQSVRRLRDALESRSLD